MKNLYFVISVLLLNTVSLMGEEKFFNNFPEKHIKNVSLAEKGNQFIKLLKEQLDQNEYKKCLETFFELVQILPGCNVKNKVDFVALMKSFMHSLWEEGYRKELSCCVEQLQKVVTSSWIIFEISADEARLIASTDPVKAFYKMCKLQQIGPLSDWPEDLKLFHLEVELGAEQYFIKQAEAAKASYEKGRHSPASELFLELYETASCNMLTNRLNEEQTFQKEILLRKACENLILSSQSGKVIPLLKVFLDKQEDNDKYIDTTCSLQRLLALALRESGYTHESIQILDALILNDPKMEEHYQIDKAIVHFKCGQSEKSEKILRKIIGMGNLVHAQIKDRATIELAKALMKKSPDEATHILNMIIPKSTLDQKEKSYISGLIALEKGELHKAKNELIEAIDFPQYALWKEDAIFQLTEILGKEINHLLYSTSKKIWGQIERQLQSCPNLREKTVLNLARIDSEINRESPSSSFMHIRLKEILKNSIQKKGEILYLLVQSAFRANLPEESAQFLGLLQNKQFENTPWPALAWLYLTSNKIEEEESGYHQVLMSALQAIEKTDHSFFKNEKIN